MSKVDEEIMGREWKTPCYIAFYTKEGYALREQMTSKLNHMDGRLHRQCERKARELGAASYAIFKHWVSFEVPEVQEDDSFDTLNRSTDLRKRKS
jgi:hypothetical protein